MQALAVSYKRVYYIFISAIHALLCERKTKQKQGTAVAKRNTSILINGKHYDAITGQLLNHAQPKQSVDGFTAASKSENTASSSAAKVIDSVKATPKGPARKPAARAVKAHPKPSGTLMRHSVKKPQASIKRRAKTRTSTLTTVHHRHPTTTVIGRKVSVYSVNHQRQQRASQTSVSPRVAHFAHELAAHTPTFVHQAVSAVDKAIILPPTSSIPSRYRPDVTPARKQQKTTDVFEKALLQATSHQQTPPKLRRSQRSRRLSKSLRHRMVSYSAGAVALFAVIGVFSYHTVDSVQFRVATSRTGFSASMPSYVPDGYNLRQITTNNGQVNIHYAANTITGEHTVAITEKPSTWDNSTLLNQIIARSNSIAYQVIERDNRTIYLYGANRAAWLDNGVLYQVAASSSLSTHEFTRIASSL